MGATFDADAAFTDSVRWPVSGVTAANAGSSVGDEFAEETSGFARHRKTLRPIAIPTPKQRITTNKIATPSAKGFAWRFPEPAATDFTPKAGAGRTAAVGGSVGRERCGG
jgi:hypothetical protein